MSLGRLCILQSLLLFDIKWPVGGLQNSLFSKCAGEEESAAEDEEMKEEQRSPEGGKKKKRGPGPGRGHTGPMNQAAGKIKTPPKVITGPTIRYLVGEAILFWGRKCCLTKFQ